MRVANKWMAALLVVGCGSGDKGNADTGTTEAAVTYHRDIRPVLEQNCVGCHSAGGIAPFTLTSFDDVVPQQEAIVHAVTTRAMPPWQASSDCHSLEGDRRLSDDDVALFEGWKEADFAEGDSKTFEARAPLPGVTPLQTEPDVVLTMAEPYATPITTTDNYRCFILPHTFDVDTYVTAIDVRPDQHRTVHHVQIHTFPVGSLAEAQAKDAAADGPGYPCVGAAVTGSTNIYSWRPGAPAVQMLEGDAMLVTKGTAVAIQVHYNVQGLDPGEAVPPDQSSIAMWTMPDGTLPERVIVRRGLIAGLLGTNPLVIKPGDPHVVTTQDWPASFLTTVGTTQLDGEIVGQTPHMHALGTRLSATMKASGGDQCLIDVPNWSFEWQQDYLFPGGDPVKVAPDSVVTVTCEYDNSPAHQPIVGGTPMTPREVRWGEGTYDEMCLNYAWVRFERTAYESALSGAAAPAPAAP